MNVLILTPDRVGSTLLQRVLTVYLLGQNLNKPVINLHELSNGLIKYYNTLLNSEVLGKPNRQNWAYYQSLDEITELLKSVDHYKTSRLAHYHIVRRADNIADQIKFYEYLNANFYIIGCRRENLLEYALSWAINAHSKTLNVYSVQEKIDVFSEIYKNKISVDKQILYNYLDKYKNYINWSDSYFNVQSYFNYDTDVHNIEEYILNLDFMKNQESRNWKDMFGQEFKEFNACHRLLPNLKLTNNRPDAVKKFSYLTLQNDTTWSQLKGIDWPDNPVDFIANKEKYPLAIQREVQNRFFTTVDVTPDEYNFLNKNLLGYYDTTTQLTKLTDDGFLPTTIPIKLQSLKEKMMIINNFKQCAEWYNNWVLENKFGKIYKDNDLVSISETEEQQLNAPINLQLTNNL